MSRKKLWLVTSGLFVAILALHWLAAWYGLDVMPAFRDWQLEMVASAPPNTHINGMFFTLPFMPLELTFASIGVCFYFLIKLWSLEGM